MIFHKEKFKTIRESLDLTQDDVARHLEIKRQSIQRWEDGVCCPRIPKIYKLAELFHCSAREFADFEPGEYIEQRMTVAEHRRRFGFSPIPGDISSDPAKAVDEFRKGLLMILAMDSSIDPVAKAKVTEIIATYHPEIKRDKIPFPQPEAKP